MPKKCSINGCSLAEYSRGLCNKHYQAFHRSVKNKITSWKALEDQGMASKKKKVGRKSLYEITIATLNERKT